MAFRPRGAHRRGGWSVVNGAFQIAALIDTSSLRCSSWLGSVRNDPATERRKPCLCLFGTASPRARRPFR